MSNITPFAEMQQIASVMGRNKLFGKTPEELLPLMYLAQAQGKHPAIVAIEYDIIQGKPAINSKSALSRFQQAGGRIQWIERNDLCCKASFSHPSGGELIVEWTWARAQKAQLTGKDNWKKYPTQMLGARVIAEGVRAVCPASLDGLSLPEELEDEEELKPKKTAPVQTEAVIVDEPKPVQESLTDRVGKMLDYLLSKGIGHSRVLLRLNKAAIEQIDGYDLSTIKTLIKSAEGYGLSLDSQFPVETVQETEEAEADLFDKELNEVQE